MTLTQYIQGILKQWSSKQHLNHLAAFGAGGHQHHGGSSWQPRKKFYPWPILWKSGELRSSVGYQLSHLKVTFFAESPYAVYHHFGTTNIPERPILNVTGSDVNIIVGQIKALNGIRVSGI